jgi:uncharacterized protein (TIGR02118 family)
MVTSFSLLTRRAGTNEAEFRKHWRDVHAPLVRHVDYLRGYVQNHAAPGAAFLGTKSSALDGIAEFWWDNRAAALRTSQDPRYTEHAQPDEPRFLDMSRLVGVQTTPWRLSEPSPPLPTGAAKAIFILLRQPQLSPAVFAELCATAWRTTLASTPGSVDDCVLHLADPSPDGAPPADAIIVCRWRNAGRRHAWSRGPVPHPGDDGRDRERSALFLADEHIVLAPPTLAIAFLTTAADAQ